MRDSGVKQILSKWTGNSLCKAGPDQSHPSYRPQCWERHSQGESTATTSRGSSLGNSKEQGNCLEFHCVRETDAPGEAELLLQSRPSQNQRSPSARYVKAEKYLTFQVKD